MKRKLSALLLAALLLVSLSMTALAADTPAYGAYNIKAESGYTLTPDGAVTFANHAPNLSCVQANQLVDRFFTVETARARPGGGAGERGSGAAARRSPASAAAGKAPETLRRVTVFDPEVAFCRTVLRENPAPLDNIHRLYAIMTLLLCGCGRSGNDPLC